MKVSKEGKVKLEKGEMRLGNFFIKEESEGQYIRVIDLNSCFSLRMATRMPLGIWFQNIIEMGEKGHETIHTWASTMYALLSVAPDQDFVKALVDAVDANIRRHPDWYGGLVESSEEEDAKAVEELKAIQEFEEDVKKVEDEVRPEA
jgi:hypothetical protein